MAVETSVRGNPQRAGIGPKSVMLSDRFCWGSTSQGLSSMKSPTPKPRARVRADSIVVEECPSNDFARFLAIEWDDFEKRAGMAFPFVHPRYVSFWWDHMGRSTSPHVVVARRSGELVGYAPLAESIDSISLLPMPVVRFMGNNIEVPGAI